MVAPVDRLHSPASDMEMARRLAAIRQGMKAAGLDVLMFQGNNDHMGGYVKYVTDVPATNGYTVTVVLPIDDDMTIVRQGPFGGAEEFGDDHPVFRGVKRMLTTPSYNAANYTRDYDSALICRALQPYSRASVGVVGMYHMSYAHMTYVLAQYPQMKISEASDIVDAVRAVKSAEELEMIRRTAAMQDGAMQAVFDAIKPGMRDSDAAAVAIYYSQTHGSEQGLYLCASAPAGTPLNLGQRHFQNRVLEEGDQFVILVENNGPGGHYGELGRTCVLGKVPAVLEDEFGFTLEARQHVLDQLQPGADAAEIFASFQDFMKRHGRPLESRLMGHSQGYDMVERPLIRHDETQRLTAGMNFAVHPTYVHNGAMSWICDNFFIHDDGTLERIHAFPETIVER